MEWNQRKENLFLLFGEMEWFDWKKRRVPPPSKLKVLYCGVAARLGVGWPHSSFPSNSFHFTSAIIYFFFSLINNKQKAKERSEAVREKGAAELILLRQRSGAHNWRPAGVEAKKRRKATHKSNQSFTSTCDDWWIVVCCPAVKQEREEEENAAFNLNAGGQLSSFQPEPALIQSNKLKLFDFIELRWLEWKIELVDCSSLLSHKSNPFLH